MTTPRGSALAPSDAELAQMAEIRLEDISAARAWLRRFGGPVLDHYAAALPSDREHVSAAYIAAVAATQIRFVWHAPEAVYVDTRTRQQVSVWEVRRRLDQALARGARDARSQTLALRARAIDLPQWELYMRDHIRSAQIGSHMIGGGGEAQMFRARPAAGQVTPMQPHPGIETLRARLRDQLGYLSRFAQQLEGGEQPVDGRAMARSEMYVQAARAGFEDAAAGAMTEAGYDERRNIRHAQDSCGGCLAMESLGWVSVDDPRWVPVGNRECMVNCKCEVEYRRSAGVMAEAETA